jgi:hypothetical protein
MGVRMGTAGKYITGIRLSLGGNAIAAGGTITILGMKDIV